jgi:hypothetical protein
MRKLASTLILAAFAAATFNAQAASHAGGAPVMKPGEPAGAASAPAKKTTKAKKTQGQKKTVKKEDKK